MEHHVYFLLLSILVSSWVTVSGLECYACENQKGNRDKCIKTTKQCEEHQDICRTDIKWGLPPYWVPYGDRVHFVSKNCDTKTKCQQKEADMMQHCKRDWFDDWGCVECCTGDLCNYYVTLGASGIKGSWIFVVGSTVAIVLLRHLP